MIAPRKQRGVALITAILVMAIATTAAVQMVYRQQLDIRRTQNVLAHDQAYTAALAAEGVIRLVLTRSIAKSKRPIRQEDLDQVSAKFRDFSYWGVNFSLQVQDLQGRFNLNNLVADGKASEPHVKQLRRLAGLVGGDDVSIKLNGNYTDLDQALVDWIDGNVQAQIPGGAEDDFYSRTVGRYRTANQPMAGASELRLVLQMHTGNKTKLAETWYRALRPYVTALPRDTTVNVNAASPEILASLLPDGSMKDAEQAVEERRKEAYTGVDDFLKRNPAFDTDKLDPSMLGTESDFYLAVVHTRMARANVTLYSVLQRGGSGELGSKAAQDLLRQAAQGKMPSAKAAQKAMQQAALSNGGLHVVLRSKTRP